MTENNDSQNNLNLRSEEVQEILGRPPQSIVRVGITVILLVVIGLFVGSWFIKYPDVVSAPVTVTTENLPAGVMAMTTGKIDTLFVSEKQIVKQGELLAVVHNAALWDDVLLVKERMDSIADDNSLQLGDIQSVYSTYIKAREDYAYFCKADYHNRKIAVIRKQIATQKDILNKTIKQQQLSQKQLSVAQQQFAMDSTLFAKKMLSLADFHTARSSYIQQLQTAEAAKMSLDNQQMSILQLEQAVFDLEQQRIETENSLSLALTASQSQLLAQIQNWEETFLLRAPCDGAVTFTKYWQQNQNINAGEIMMTVVPLGEKKIIGKILLPPQGAGKVKAGQTVNIKFDHFPYMEYGMVKVTIHNISLVPVQTGEKEKAYMLEVQFPDRLLTTYHKELDFSQEMTGTAEIITEDLRLFDRFLNPIRAVFQR